MLSSVACANSEERWLLTTSLYTQHFSPKPDHNNSQGLIGVSRINEENRIWGAATFSNSFDQRSVFAKVYGGLLYGYRGEYQDKIPLNGVGAAFMINVGWRM